MSTDPLAPLLDIDGVADAVATTRSAVDTLLADRTLRRRSADVSLESALRGAWASAVLAGSGSTLEQVRAGVADPLVQGALRAQAELPALVDVAPRAPRQALARLHAVAGAGLLDRQLLGRPTGAEAAARLDTLAEVLTATSAPAVVVAAIVHGEVLGVDAFAPVSGLVARACSRLVLIDRGLDPKSLVVLEVGHLTLRAEYDTALAGYRAGGADGVAAWIRHCAAAVVAGAQEATAITQSIARGA